MINEHETKEMVRCEHGDNIYLIPADVFAKVVMHLNEKEKKMVRYKTGAELYDMSVRQFPELAKDAGAPFKINRMLLVDEYVKCFRVL